MKNLKEMINGVVVCVFEILTGILLLIDPVAFTSGIMVAVGAALLITGLVNVIKYFRTSAEEAARSQRLLKGLVALLAGAICAFRNQWLIAAFPLLTMIYGAAILLTGLGKVQWAVDMIRLKRKGWFLTAISALVSVVCAGVILNSPFTSTAVLWTFTGATLIVEAAFDIAALIFGRKRMRNTADAETESKQEDEVFEP